MGPDIPCFIVDVQDTLETLEFGCVEAVPAEDVRVIVPVGGDFVDCEESFCAVFDGGGELVEGLFGEVCDGLEGGVYVVDWVDVCDPVVGIAFKLCEMFFEDFHARDEFFGEGCAGGFIVSASQTTGGK